MTKLQELIAQLPAGLRSDWQNTNHFELTDIDARTWLDFNDLTGEYRYIRDTTDEGKRVGLLMDIAAELVRIRDNPGIHP